MILSISFRWFILHILFNGVWFSSYWVVLIRMQSFLPSGGLTLRFQANNYFWRIFFFVLEVYIYLPSLFYQKLLRVFFFFFLVLDLEMTWLLISIFRCWVLYAGVWIFYIYCVDGLNTMLNSFISLFFKLLGVLHYGIIKGKPFEIMWTHTS